MKNRTLRRSFANAFAGMQDAFGMERNFRVHMGMVLLVVLMGIWLEIDAVRWGVLALACGTVLVAELLNTAMERLVDMVTRDRSEAARQVKDMAAGAVLVAAGFAALCGVAVFTEPLLLLLGVS